ncbi:NAD-dependent succinate-semialdehyde dehydrogenase [Weeksellaceae bacterium TAE3-ERU29]|nr:NAD-dependent succinate-semialdehyde dehydrogenase [Weeksellaceae bacterium TAE3-ERU29]
MKSTNPYTQEIVFETKEFNSEQIQEKLKLADKAFYSWRKINIKDRTKIFSKLSDILENHAEEWGKVMTLEMGKPISQSIAEIQKCAWVCRYYAENAESQLQSKIIETDAQKSYVRYDPLGVILGVMPWNYPFWQVIRFAVPTLLAGNTVILKHAGNVMESAKNIEKAFDLAGLPKNCFINLPIKHDKIEDIIRNPIVKGVSLTGSKPAGASVAKIAGEEIKPSLLELGGSNALAVFEDCDLKKTAETVISARFQNTGQSCIAGKRLLVHENISKQFLELLKQKVEKLKSGNPMDKEIFIGTLARVDLAKDLEKQMQKSLDQGATLLIGGKRENAYFEPTILTNVTTEMSVFKEETFGPLLACVTFKTDEEALDFINKSEFGLGASIFTKDKNRMEYFIENIKDGAVFVNELVKSDPRLPFGGTGISGYGRELSENGIKAFVNKKTVYIA